MKQSRTLCGSWAWKPLRVLCFLFEGNRLQPPWPSLNSKWSESCPVMSDSLLPHGLQSPWNPPGQNSGVGSLSLLQMMFPTQGSNPGLPPCRWILYQLSHKGSPRTLEWVAYPFSSRASRPRNWTGVSCIAGGFFTSWATREALLNSKERFKYLLIREGRGYKRLGRRSQETTVQPWGKALVWLQGIM